MKKKLMEFVLSVLDKVFKFFGRWRCACCNSTCVVDKSVNTNCPENNIIDDIDEVFKTTEDKEK